MGMLKIPTSCALCGEKFIGPVVALGGVLEPGDVVGSSFMRFLRVLFEHVQKKHPEHFQVSQAKASELQGWYILSLFGCEDPEVREQRDYFRWSVHQLTLKARAENIEARARQVAEEFVAANFYRPAPDSPQRLYVDDLAARITGVLNELRDLLEEPSAYTPVDPESALKTASNLEI